MKVKIKFVEWGIAARFGDVIELNKDLINYPELLAPIMQHELRHTNEEKFTFQDFKVDFMEKININRYKFYTFMLKHPKTWINILPFYYQPSKGLVYDLNKMLVYLLAIYLATCWYIILASFGLI